MGDRETIFRAANRIGVFGPDASGKWSTDSVYNHIVEGLTSLVADGWQLTPPSVTDDDPPRIEPCAFCGAPTYYCDEVDTEPEGMMGFHRCWIWLCQACRPAAASTAPTRDHPRTCPASGKHLEVGGANCIYHCPGCGWDVRLTEAGDVPHHSMGGRVSSEGIAGHPNYPPADVIGTGWEEVIEP